MRIDSHHHFWKYNAEEYGWIGEGMERLRRDFLPVDLAEEIAEVEINAVISVQARQTEEETAWLLKLATEHNFIKAVVGWVPLIAPDVEGILEVHAANPKLRAVRHVLQGEADESYMLRPDFNAGISLLQKHNLVYDILIFERQLPQTIEFVDKHPNQPFVLDHIAKPLIAKGELEPWATQIRELAKRENVSCKFSGLVTEADWNQWTPSTLEPYWNTVLEAFGPSRLMFGSDWPVCLVASEYEAWVETVEEYAISISHDEFDALFGNTAARVYGVK